MTAIRSLPPTRELADAQRSRRPVAGNAPSSPTPTPAAGHRPPPPATLTPAEEAYYESLAPGRSSREVVGCLVAAAELSNKTPRRAP
ncbi:MAG: hypothetical protein LBK99_22840 [Opitutaceae bacterium]|jgi:hypothetical protein|nr:hypothetical protein [Opitutaceae bacterium]